MPRERRKIIFSRDELLLAVASYSRMTPEFLPAGDIQDVSIVERPLPHLVITVEMRYGRQRQTVEITAEAETLLDLLVRACLENNIPIPRRATKGFDVVEGDLAIRIDIDPEDALGIVSGAEPVPLRPVLVRQVGG